MGSFETIFLVYFLYGLTFFVMGLVLLLESWRIEPRAPQKNLFQPLALFGLMHGVHEWLEIFLRITSGASANAPQYLLWLRILLLAGSFIALGIYSVRAYLYARSHVAPLALFAAAILPVFAILTLLDVLFAFSRGNITIYPMIESLVRYLLGVPGSVIASIGLAASARKAHIDQRRPLDTYLNLTAAGFAMYSLTQLFVPAMNTQLANILNMEAFQSWTAIPIQTVRTFTAFLITAGSFTATRYMENERQRLVAAVQQARVEALEQQEVMRKDLLRHIVRAQEEERARIARELHDEMAQTLTAFSLDLATLQHSVGSKSKSGQLITRLQDLGKQMSNGIQRLVYDLRPAHLDDFGLVSALKFLADYESPRLNLKVDLRFDGEICRLDPLVETVIYRTAQEALTNAARHAQAEEICVCLSCHPDQVCLKVIDQGVGFDPEQQFIPPSGWGLAGMRERAESVGGNLQIQSKPGEGTTIVIVIPHGMTRE